MRQIREKKHCVKKTILQLASGDNVAPMLFPVHKKKQTHEVKVHKSDYNTSYLQIRLASYIKLAKTTVPTPTTNFSS